MILRKFIMKSGAHAINGLYEPDEYEQLVNLLNKRIEEGTDYVEEYKDILEQVLRSTKDANAYDIKNGAGEGWKTFVIYPEHILNFVYLALQMPLEKEKSNMIINDLRILYNETIDEIINKNHIQTKGLLRIMKDKDDEIEKLKTEQQSLDKV